MDSLIRLDTIFPNASSVDDKTVPENALNPQLRNGVSVIDLCDESEVVDNQIFLPIPMEDVAVKPDTDISIVTVIEEGLSTMSPNRSPVKHKLPVSPNHRSSKVPKTSNILEVPFSLVANIQHIHPNTPLSSISTVKLPLQTMKTHTITSGEISDLPLAGTSRKTNIEKEQKVQTNFIDQQLNLGLPNDIQCIHPNTPLPSISTVKLPLQTMKTHTITSGAMSDLPLAGTSRETHIEKEQKVQTNVIGQQLNPVQPNGDARQKSEREDSMFYQLLDIFPDINLQFLKDQCHSGLVFNEITEKILSMENYPKDDDQSSLPYTSGGLTNNSSVSGSTVDLNKAFPSNKCTETNKTLDKAKVEQNGIDGSDFFRSQLNFLMEIFPDADPNFMEIKCKLKENELRNFITECMEKDDYPKVTALVKQEASEIQDEIGLYTTDFNLESFLKIFPNPFEYFLDEKRNCQCSAHGLEFLKRRYRCHSVKIIAKMYKEFKYNLVKTCEYLDGQKPTRCTRRGLNEIAMPNATNLPFLQEACFIEHKDEIKKFLDGVSEAKRLAYEQAEANKELIDCGCCYAAVMFEDCVTCNEGHLFCKTCVRKSVDVRIGDGLTSFPCLQDCDSIFSLKLLETLLDATMFSRLLQRIQIDEVRAADIEGLEVCPFCDFAIILPPETNIFKCFNPECLKESCRKCHRLSHIPQRCEELESDEQARARKYIEDEMTRALVRECYKCKKSFIKIDGCNKMTCTCGAKMCYICRQPIVDYKHFNGPGGEEKNKCPLYSTEKLLHVDAVEAVAKKALEEVTAKHPEIKLKHDPTKVLPSADKAKTTLPPGVNEDGHMLLNVLHNLQQYYAGQ